MNKKFAVLVSLSLALVVQTACAGTAKKETAGTTSPLMSASAEGDVKKLNSLVKSKVDINAKDKAGYTALMVAASNGHQEAAKFLLEHKADVNIKNQEGQTALYFALVNEQPEIALDLIKQGAMVDDISGEGESALLIATTANQNDIMNLLIKKKPALVNKASNASTTPLMEAARFGSAKTASILLKAGADKKAKNQNGKTALDIAIKAQNEDVVKLLKK
ncbi:ankyrin repeat domain-containing protein [Bdellovibrio svalbardensis]|uniref:Ankyrin repeat domain-containing protein n=1 Tax=Bdellovibrio svalbardensis TaxID=2972972 RepID=A0ABT6DFQ2_9BACT|nr:ankyrin repeat domain-containing protein [Bdellovibrio svalbardensis]MDG0815297.1 ankyrin repeat domain-containing protein [Bdellovibrio svalbardensis]